MQHGLDLALQEGGRPIISKIFVGAAEGGQL